MRRTRATAASSSVVVDPAVGERGRERLAVRRGSRQLGIDARDERQPARLAEVRRQSMGRRDHLDADVVRGDDPVEAPLPAQDPGQQLGRGMTGHTVDVAVGRHDAGDPGRPDRGFEREQLLVPQLARADVDRGLVEPALRESVADHVLAGGDHAVTQIGTLDRLDVGAAELRGEVRILAVRLLDPSPARIARDVKDRRESLPSAGHQHPAADRRGHRGHDVRIEARRGADRLLEARRVGGDEPVEAFLMDDGRDPEPRPLDEIALDRVGGLGNLDRPQVGRAREPGDLADAVGGEGGQPRLVEARTRGRPRTPRTTELGDLLGAGHPREQVGDARLDRERRVAVGGLDRRHQPFTDPAVRPPTMCRSAMM